MLTIAPETAISPAAATADSLRAHPAAAAAVSLSLHDNLADVATLWRAFEASADCTVFQTFAWHQLWQQHIGDAAGTKPAIVVGRAGGRVLFVLPLAVSAARMARRLTWHASDLCDYNGPLLAPDFAAAVSPAAFIRLWSQIEDLIASTPGLNFDVAVLRHMPEHIGAQRNPFLDLAVSASSSGAHYMQIYGPWEQFYRDKRSSATRRHDRVKIKRMAELGTVRFETVTEPCAAEAVLDALFVQKAASFAAHGVANFLARPGRQAFFRAVAAEPALRDIVHISDIKVGTRIAAANLGFIFRRRYYHFIASYDGGAVGRFGPGTAHLHALVDYALQHGCTVFDFTVGDEAYKRDWCDSEERMFDYRASRNARGVAAAAASIIAMRVKRRIKQTPQLWAAYVRLRLMAAFLRGGLRHTEQKAAAAAEIERSASI